MGDADLGEHLDKYRDREVVLIIASVGKAGKKKVTCGICGFVIGEAGACLRCKMMAEETARDTKAEQEMRKAMFGEVEEILGHEDE